MFTLAQKLVARSMAAFGTYRTLIRRPLMSAFEGKADVTNSARHVGD
jgi:hypothetical protein